MFSTVTINGYRGVGVYSHDHPLSLRYSTRGANYPRRSTTSINNSITTGAHSASISAATATTRAAGLATSSAIELPTLPVHGKVRRHTVSLLQYCSSSVASLGPRAGACFVVTCLCLCCREPTRVGGIAALQYGGLSSRPKWPAAPKEQNTYQS